MRLLHLALLGLLTTVVSGAEPEFPLTADSKPQPDVPKGTLLKGTHTAKDGSVFPGTVRDYQLYLPAGFDKAKPAPFMVFQDGVIYQAPVVLDNLIAQKAIPPLVGIFIKPGVVPAANDNALPRFNRSFEYDSVTDTYSRFLLNEFLPAIEAAHGLQFSTDPNHAAIAGNSSGGICAFMAAWHRPDRFRRVFTGVGTYVGIRGADRLPVLVRKIEPKPLRVFLQSGTGDNDLYCGDWWMANQMMQRSLAWAGYDVNHAWGEGGHNQKHATQVFPDAMRWLWRDWQTDIEVKANPKGESKWKGYEVVGDGKWTATDLGAGSFLQVTADGKVSLAAAANARAINQTGQRFDLAPTFTTLTPDQSLLLIATQANRLVHSQQALSGRHDQAFHFLEADFHHSMKTGGLCVDTDGRLYVATSLGIQVCDQAGRVNFILPTPQPAHDVCLGGKDLSELFIACGDKIYKRSTKVKGYISGQMAPIKPAPPKL
jgi:enterochelin esterase-like enzyme